MMRRWMLVGAFALAFGGCGSTGQKVLQDFGIKDPLLIAPGDPDRSILFQRVARRGPGQMPPLATSEVDRQAAELLREWIRQLK